MIRQRTESDQNTGFALNPGIVHPDHALRMGSAKVLERLEQLSQIGIALSKERDTNRLLETILAVAKGITNADGGTLYRVSENRTLEFEILQTDSLGLAMGGTTGVEIPFDPVQLYDSGGKRTLSNVVSYAYHYDTSLNIADAYTEKGFDFSGTKNMDKRTGYRSKSFLTVPMKNHENEIIGILQLLNATDPETGSVTEFSMEDQQLVESLASQAAIALTNRLLISHLEHLFESLIQLINRAIDDKSPHTGQHCDRVPILTMMLADAVSSCKIGPLKEFSMTEKDDTNSKSPGCCTIAARSPLRFTSSKKPQSFRRFTIESKPLIPASKSSNAMRKLPCCAPSSSAVLKGDPQSAEEAAHRFSQQIRELKKTVHSCISATSAAKAWIRTTSSASGKFLPDTAGVIRTAPKPTSSRLTKSKI